MNETPIAGTSAKMNTAGPLYEVTLPAIR
jgi:hypothetical protein